MIQISGRRVDGSDTVVEIEVRDDMSAISTVEYSVDGQEWTPLYPMDGIADSPVEQFELRLRNAGTTDAMIRATDVLNNTGGASTGVVEQP